MIEYLDSIWLRSDPEYWSGLEFELTWFFIKGIMRGMTAGEAFWYALCEWDV